MLTLDSRYREKFAFITMQLAHPLPLASVSEGENFFRMWCNCCNHSTVIFAKCSIMLRCYTDGTVGYDIWSEDIVESLTHKRIHRYMGCNHCGVELAQFCSLRMVTSIIGEHSLRVERFHGKWYNYL